MSDNSHIEWTDATWNPTTGCTKVSEGCRHCYIDRTPAFRIGSKPKNGELIPPRRFDSEEIGGTTGVMVHPERLEQPLRWKRPRRIFVNSLSDLFHDDISDEFIVSVFATMALTQRHIFQVLTKRPRRMMSLLSCPTFPRDVSRAAVDMPFEKDAPSPWPLPNVWLGASVEDQKTADQRIPLLCQTPAALRFLSCEPLLGPVDLTATPVGQALGECESCGQNGYPGCDACQGVGGINWVIVGGESGPKARPMHPDWARSIRDQCDVADVPFFFKQWGNWCHPSQLPADVDGSGSFLDDFINVGKKRAGRELDDRTWDEMPDQVAV